MKKALLLLPLTLAAIVFGCLPGLRAQQFDMSTDHLPITSLNGQWRFHPGDNPAWSQPDVDDSTWPLLNSTHIWDARLYRDPSGIGWYRFRVSTPANHPPLTINLPHFLTCYQLFADGQLIGSYGQMPPHPVPTSGDFNQLYKIPATIASRPTITFAIRVWQWPELGRFFGGGPLYGGALIGRSLEVGEIDQEQRASRHWILNSTLILALLQTLAALGSLALYLLRRSEREYLWFSLVQISSAAVSWLALSFYFTAWPLTLHNQVESVLLGPCLNFAEIAFYFSLLKGRKTILFWIAVASTAASLPYSILSSTVVLNPFTAYLGQDLLMLPVYLWILTLLFTRAWRNYLDARLLFLPVFLQKGCLLFQQGAILTSILGWQHRFDFRIRLTNFPFQIELIQAVDSLFLLAVLTILILRFTRTRSLEERYASEVEGARSVQQFLIPDDLPHVPGFHIESAYHPSREVGGDFFQVLPPSSNDPLRTTLIVLGDVAGKGLEAGMLATLIVGAVGTTNTFTSDPATILSTLNNRLCGRGNATCLALSITSSGLATLVNAGHIAPYLNGEELPMEGALPLGTIPNLDFPVMHFQIEPGDSLILISDGIIEAQSSTGELFGFERTNHLVRQSSSAAALATAAQRFGQEDDITVLTITRQGL